MHVDITEFPHVWMDFTHDAGQTTDEVLEVYTDLLAGGEPFVFLGEGGDFEGDNTAQDVADRKKISLWMKRNKRTITALVRAMIYIEPNVSKRIAARAFALVYEKFWGYPMFVAANRDEAMAIVRTVLFFGQEADLEFDAPQSSV
ncbi:hypothetical protein [Ensifer sp. 4252]|uniref:hypothetical protein n=1 Tax=Ensifer sp. 4252 TaxID=3373915 RepID=UPI003D1EDDEF